MRFPENGRICDFARIVRYVNLLAAADLAAHNLGVPRGGGRRRGGHRGRSQATYRGGDKSRNTICD